MKKWILSFLLLFFALCPETFVGNLFHSAHANGVIVTAPENTPPKKTAPPKKSPVKKEALPTPPPAPEIEEAIKPTPLDEALILMEQRFFTKATALLEQIVLREPLNAHAWYVLSRAYEARGLFPKAQRAFRRTLEIDPAFNELSRFLEYPAEGKRHPLWDPKRPARIEEIPVAIDGFTIMPPAEMTIPPVSPLQPPVQYTSPVPAVSAQPPLFPSSPTEPHTSISRSSGVPVRVVQPGATPSHDPADSPERSLEASVSADARLTVNPPLLDSSVPAYIPPPALPAEVNFSSPDILSEGVVPVYTPPPPGVELPR